MAPIRRKPIPYNPQSAPFQSSTAIQEGEEMGDAVNTLLGMKSATLTPEEIAEFESAVDEEFAKFTTGGSRKKMRGGDVPEVITKSKELWSAVLKTMATPENAGIAVVASTVGIASPALVHSAFSVARAALGLAAQAVTPETVALTSCAALVYYYFGDKLIPKGESISEQIAIGRMNNAIETAKKTRRGSATLRVVIDKFKEDLDKSKSLTNWEATEDEALQVQRKIATDTGRSKIGVDEVKSVKPLGPSIGNYAIPPTQINTSKAAPLPPQAKNPFGPKGGKKTKKRSMKKMKKTRRGIRKPLFKY
jgi:hypothetical protein